MFQWVYLWRIIECQEINTTITTWINLNLKYNIETKYVIYYYFFIGHGTFRVRFLTKRIGHFYVNIENWKKNNWIKWRTRLLTIFPKWKWKPIHHFLRIWGIHLLTKFSKFGEIERHKYGFTVDKDIIPFQQHLNPPFPLSFLIPHRSSLYACSSFYLHRFSLQALDPIPHRLLHVVAYISNNAASISDSLSSSSSKNVNTKGFPKSSVDSCPTLNQKVYNHLDLFLHWLNSICISKAPFILLFSLINLNYVILLDVV